jgi:hypothetical protein
MLRAARVVVVVVDPLAQIFWIASTGPSHRPRQQSAE